MSTDERDAAMRVIDIDPGLLRASAAAAAHAAEQTTTHIDAEIAGRVPELMDTLRDTGPYAYSLLSEVDLDGRVKLPIMTTSEEIRAAYTMIRGASDLLRVDPLVEIRGTWYTFHEGISHGRRKGSDTVNQNQTLALFPVSSDKGITGELVWVYRAPASLGAGARAEAEPLTPVHRRRDLLALHDRYLQALRAADVRAVLDVLDHDAQSVIRDYVDDTGTIVDLEGTAAHRSYYKALFEKYTIESVELLDRVVQDWYVFAELRYTASQQGKSVSFHTAEFHLPAHDGRLIGRIGHGTDPR